MLTIDKRPFSFGEMIGQKGILSEMKKRSLSKNFPEVMIFEGDSGTGKTTLAFIISALINEKNPLDRGDYLDPDPNSKSSKSILNETFNRDVHFFDASVMGKDDVISLEEIVGSSPMFDENKVIIIDEAQELSKAGKGVTLKLLEKKRKNVHIILCTMNINAFDKAVKTRGQLYTFRNPSSSDIAEYLFNLLKYVDSDNIPDEFLETGIFTIAENCEGSVRYAVQNLERCITGELFTEEEISKELGFLSNERLTSLIMDILNKEKSCIPKIIDFSCKDFFYKANKTILEAVIFKNTGYVSSDWKRSFSEKIQKYEDLEKLAEIFIDINSQAYFKEDLFLFKLSQFMKQEKSAPVVKIRERVKK